MAALDEDNPSAFCETVVEVPNISWKDIGGVKEIGEKEGSWIKT